MCLHATSVCQSGKPSILHATLNPDRGRVQTQTLMSVNAPTGITAKSRVVQGWLAPGSALKGNSKPLTEPNQSV